MTTTSTAEKKLSILASALKYHPRSEELLCQLLQLNTVVSSVAESNDKYQAMLSRLPHSLSLWRSYWTYLKSTFSDFSCEKMRGVYEGSLKGIETGLQTRASLVIQSEKAEEDVILAFLCGVQFDLQSGYTEKGIAKIQVCASLSVAAAMHLIYGGRAAWNGSSVSQTTRTHCRKRRCMYFSESIGRV